MARRLFAVLLLLTSCASAPPKGQKEARSACVGYELSSKNVSTMPKDQLRTVVEAARLEAGTAAKLNAEYGRLSVLLNELGTPAGSAGTVVALDSLCRDIKG